MGDTPTRRDASLRCRALRRGGAYCSEPRSCRRSPPPGAIDAEARGPWTLVVETVGAARDGQQTATLRIVRTDGVPGVRVAATLPAFPEVAPGDRVTVDGRIRPRPTTPYGAYLERIGAAGTLTARSMTVERGPAEPCGRDRGPPPRGRRRRSRRSLPEPEAGLAAGILIGLRDRVDRDLAAAFTTAGVSHVVAISGLEHRDRGRGDGRRVRPARGVAVARSSRCSRSSRTWRSPARRRRSCAPARWPASCCWPASRGAPGGRLRRSAGPRSSCCSPTRDSSSDAGFQLSALATAGLIAWATPLTAWLDARGRGRVPRWLAESLGVSLAAQAATLPIVLIAFGRLAVLSPLVNLAIVPLVAPAMAAGLLAMVGGGLVSAGAPADRRRRSWRCPGWVVAADHGRDRRGGRRACRSPA